MPQLINKVKEDEIKEAYDPKGQEKEIQTYLIERIPVLKDSKKKILENTDFEQIMKDADREYVPHNLRDKRKLGSMFVQDETKGLRGSRLVPISDKEGEEWRSDASEPLLMTKVQTALSILINQNPEATFKALVDKYKKSTNVAHSLWKRSWDVGRSRHQLKLFILDLAKYGWAIAKTYPRLVQRQGEILEELDIDNPEKNKYKKVTITEYNDIYREKLDPYRTWIDDMTNLTDPWSMDDWYYEKDFSKDAFKREFEKYSNLDLIKFGLKKSDEENIGNDETKQRDDIVTVGFYESKNKDLYCIWVPEQNIVLYSSPLPNDDKKLSCWWTYWNERDPRTPYGIGLFEIMKNDKVLYDRLSNMSVDQLVMAIYPMLFFSGANQVQGTGDMIVSPGLIKQKAPGTSIEQVKIAYDGRGFEGVGFIRQRIDESTGITPTLQGEIEGKTLGETLHAKDAALKRLSIPISNIAQALEDEAYISLSWMNQIYSVPEVKDFVSLEELQQYEKESGTVSATYQEQAETGEVTADFYPTLPLGLDENREGVLEEAPEDRYFKVGIDLSIESLKWEGKVSIRTQSLIAPSQEIDRQRKLELFNLISPVVGQIAQMISQMPEVAIALAKPVVQILEIQDEKPENWLPDEVVKALEDPEAYLAQKKAEQEQAMMAQQGMMGTEQPPPSSEEQPLFIDAGQAGNPPQAEKVVPQGEVSNPLRASLGQVERPR